MEKNMHSGTAKPPIHISETDYALIASQAMRLEATAPQVAEMLLEEIDRAEIHSRDELPSDVVTLGSAVTFVDESTGVRRRVQIVLPADADIERSSLSIASQVGAGLIGLSAGQSIDWPCPDGRPRTLRIVDVEQSPAPVRPPPRSPERARARLGLTGRPCNSRSRTSEGWRLRESGQHGGHLVQPMAPACDRAGTSPKLRHPMG